MLRDGNMFFNRNAFMITPERKLKFMTVDKIPIQTAKQKSGILNKVIQLYAWGGLIISVLLMDVDP